MYSCFFFAVDFKVLLSLCRIWSTNIMLQNNNIKYYSIINFINMLYKYNHSLVIIMMRHQKQSFNWKVWRSETSWETGLVERIILNWFISNYSVTVSRVIAVFVKFGLLFPGITVCGNQWSAPFSWGYVFEFSQNKNSICIMQTCSR